MRGMVLRTWENRWMKEHRELAAQLLPGGESPLGQVHEP
jgi:hypothetical protein